ncbi:MAG: aminoacyl-histidine dipeptidase [Schleiferiaceae bacterium]
MEVRNLEPNAMWNHFADLNAVPRPSKKEERVIKFMVDFGESLGLPVSVDATGNILITKPASPGMENRQTVVLQSHVDMVHQKNNDTDFDFDTQGIEMFVDGDWVKAKGTTLGADNGIGVASIMTILSSTDIPHPPIEAFFTVDEETGMTGAFGLEPNVLTGSILLNLDTEDDDELTIGCAGGVDVTATRTLDIEAASGLVGYTLEVKGLSGGHSGMDIHKGLGNANKIMNRILIGAEEFGARVSSIDGGSLRNAIPRESKVVLGIPSASESDFKSFVSDFAQVLTSEYKTTDPDLEVVLESTDAPASVLSTDCQSQMLKAVAGIPNGIYRMSPDIADLVQTSSNLARIIVDGDQFQAQCLTRSAVDSEKMDMANSIGMVFSLMGCEYTLTGSYPGWSPNPHATIVSTMTEKYKSLFGDEPKVLACHAGLECGILGTHYPEMEMISFGPNIRGAHSPDEKVQISSVNKYWKLFLQTLADTPEK